MKSARFDAAASASNWLVNHQPPSCFERWMRQRRPWTPPSPAAAATAAVTCSTVLWLGSTPSFLDDYQGMSTVSEAVIVALQLRLA